MRSVIIFFINIYQVLLSSDTGIIGRYLFSGKTCGFYPTCSEYTKQALKKHGVLKGTRLGIQRIIKCTPSHEGEVDLVP